MLLACGYRAGDEVYGPPTTGGLAGSTLTNPAPTCRCRACWIMIRPRAKSTSGQRRPKVSPNLRLAGTNVTFGREGHSRERTILLQKPATHADAAVAKIPTFSVGNSSSGMTEHDLRIYREKNASAEGGGRRWEIEKASARTRVDAFSPPYSEKPDYVLLDIAKAARAVLPDLLAPPVLGLDTETTGLDVSKAVVVQ